MNSLEELNNYSSTGIPFTDDRPYNIEFAGSLADYNFGIVEDVELTIPNSFNGAFSNLQSLNDETTEHINIKFDFTSAVNPQVDWPTPPLNVEFSNNIDQTQFFANKIQTNSDFLFILNNTVFTFVDQEIDFSFTITVSYADPNNISNIIEKIQTYNATVVATSPELENETLDRNYIRGGISSIFAGADPMAIVDQAADQIYSLALTSTVNNLLSIPDTVDTTGWAIQPNFVFPYQSTLTLYGSKSEINAIIPLIEYHGAGGNPLTDTITYELRNIFVQPNNYLTASGSFNLIGTNRTTDESWEGLFENEVVSLTPERALYSIFDFLVVGGGGGGGVTTRINYSSGGEILWGGGGGAGGFVYLVGINLLDIKINNNPSLLGVAAGLGGEKSYVETSQGTSFVVQGTNGGNSLIVTGGGGPGVLVTAYGGGVGGHRNAPGFDGGSGGGANTTLNAGSGIAPYIAGLSYQFDEIYSVDGSVYKGGGAGIDSNGVSNIITGNPETYASGGLGGDVNGLPDLYPGSGGRGGWEIGADPNNPVDMTSDGQQGTVIIRIRKPT